MSLFWHEHKVFVELLNPVVSRRIDHVLPGFYRVGPKSSYPNHFPPNRQASSGRIMSYLVYIACRRIKWNKTTPWQKYISLWPNPQYHTVLKKTEVLVGVPPQSIIMSISMICLIFSTCGLRRDYNLTYQDDNHD